MDRKAPVSSRARVSVIIPAYNAAKYLSRSISSALRQSWVPYEVIVVDDGSVDNTVEVVESYGSRVRFFRQENAGAAAARNAGASAARGDLFAFLDADDQWRRDKLQIQVSVLSRRPDLAFCCCQYRVGVEGQEPIPITSDPSVRFLSDFREMFRRPYFGTPTVVMPRRVFEACSGFDETLRVAEDLDLWLRAAYGRSVGIVDSVLVDIFKVPDSLTMQGTHAGHLSVIERFCGLHPEFAERERNVVAKTRADIYTAWASEALLAGRREEAASLLRQGMRYAVTGRALYLFAKVWLLQQHGKGP